MSVELGKKAAGAFAAGDLVVSGMKVGLGSGSTAAEFVRALGERVRGGLDILGVPTSRETGALAESLDIPLATLDQAGALDLVIDGADEIDSRFQMIKGGGACLLWEKIVSHAARKMIVVVDEAKQVEYLGRFPLPVEVIPFSWKTTRRLMGEVFVHFGLPADTMSLRGGESDPLITDSGHYILDCRLEKIVAVADLCIELNRIPGVVENGLFPSEAVLLVVGKADGSIDVIEKPTSK